MPKAVLGEAGRRIQRRNALQKNIRAKMAGEEYTQSQLGKELGISQVAASQKIKKLQFSYEDLVNIFAVLKFSDAEILEVMKK